MLITMKRGESLSEHDAKKLGSYRDTLNKLAAEIAHANLFPAGAGASTATATTTTAPSSSSAKPPPPGALPPSPTETAASSDVSGSSASASGRRRGSVGGVHGGPGHVQRPSLTEGLPSSLGPEWDVTKTAREYDALDAAATKEIAKAETKNSGGGGLVGWFKKLSRGVKKPSESRACAMAAALLPALRAMEREMQLWLIAISERKELTVQVPLPHTHTHPFTQRQHTHAHAHVFRSLYARTYPSPSTARR